jgi:hypothetical protein
MSLHSPEGVAVGVVGVGMDLAAGVGMGLAGVVGFTDLAEAVVGFTGLPPMVAGLTWVMDGVATH